MVEDLTSVKTKEAHVCTCYYVRCRVIPHGLSCFGLWAIIGWGCMAIYRNLSGNLSRLCKLASGDQLSTISSRKKQNIVVTVTVI